MIIRSDQDLLFGLPEKRREEMIVVFYIGNYLCNDLKAIRNENERNWNWNWGG